MTKKIITGITLVIVLIGGYAAWQVFGPVVSVPDGRYLYIKTGSVYEDVRTALIEKKIVNNSFFLDLVAKKINYPNAVKAGRFEIKSGSSLVNLLRMLRNGRQSPINVVITKIRTVADLAGKLSKNFETDSVAFFNYLTDEKNLQQYELDSNSLMTAIIPNTYSFLWNSSPETVFKKFNAEKDKFWNEERLTKAKELNLTPEKIYALASIVEEETNAPGDKGLIASVYLNRIEKGMKLQADPTVKFAMKNFGLRRILFNHLEFPSPYNTYRNTGLPPGPICTPSIKTIDAVLDAPKTNYIFFVAKPDFNGRSNFAENYTQHMAYAKAYQKALDSLIRSKAK